MRAILIVVLGLIPFCGQCRTIYKGTAKFVVKTKHLKEFKDELGKIIAPTRKEKGNISYEAFQIVGPSGAPTNVFEFHELWVSEESMMIDHKEKSDHMKSFFQRVQVGNPNGMIETFEVHGDKVEVL